MGSELATECARIEDIRLHKNGCGVGVKRLSENVSCQLRRISEGMVMRTAMAPLLTQEILRIMRMR